MEERLVVLLPSFTNSLIHRLKLVGCHGLAPCSVRVRAGASLSKFAALMVVRKDRDAKAELNRRSQACEVLTGTGISRRVRWNR